MFVLDVHAFMGYKLVQSWVTLNKLYENYIIILIYFYDIASFKGNIVMALEIKGVIYIEEINVLAVTKCIIYVWNCYYEGKQLLIN